MSRARALIRRFGETTDPSVTDPDDGPAAGGSCPLEDGVRRLMAKSEHLKSCADVLFKGLKSGDKQTSERLSGLKAEEVDDLIYRLLNSAPDNLAGQAGAPPPISVDTILAGLGSYPDQPSTFPADLADTTQG